MSESAKAYLEQVINTMQQNALHRDEIDWNNVRQEMFQHAQGAQTSLDVYPAIYFGLTQLREKHSFLKLPDSFSEEQRQRTNQDRSAIFHEYYKTAAKYSPSPFLQRSDPSGHMDHFNSFSFAHIVIPTCAGKFTEREKNAPIFQHYADSLHAIASELALQHPDGWVIDLRGNDGGSVWPMLAGIGLVLGEGKLGSFVFPAESSVGWYYRDGKAGTISGNHESISAQVKEKPFVLSPLPLVAVLLDRGTTSSGEAVAIAFAGRQRERSFGERTRGFSTDNRDFPLPDGAILFLNVGIDADRTHRQYPDGVEPDVVLPPLENMPAEDTDPVLKSAEEWLSSANTTRGKSGE